MARPRRIRLERGDTLGGTAPLILLKKGDGKPFREGELRRRSRKNGRFKTSTIVWNVVIVLFLAAVVVALLGQGNGEGPFDRLMGNTDSSVFPADEMDLPKP
ncbi:hypothetical protein [Aestuariispira ectoiniformans]|uniref:hypothetical protein n=1 Tax=Aestuariispira ectoiniformans TaxID=2775080 RepID=UPI00223BC2D2|nr:hypothetical protein [Aestuariispira ectoiniformans]